MRLSCLMCEMGKTTGEQAGSKTHNPQSEALKESFGA